MIWLSLKNGEWVRHSYQHSSHSSCFDYYQADLPHDILEILVNRAEMIAHMNPSGLDAKTCLSDRPIRFIKNVGFTELEMDLSAYLVIADTGVYASTLVKLSKWFKVRVRMLCRFCMPWEN